MNGKLIVIGKVIYNWRNYCKIKITEDSIEQKQLVIFYIEDRDNSSKEKLKII